jgi:DnaK suppressor protein
VSAPRHAHRVAHPRRRSKRPRSLSRQEVLRRLLEDTDRLVRQRLRDVREGHPVQAAGATEAEEWVQADSSREVEASLLEKEAEERRLVEDALRRAARGDDAVCVRCGEPISPARLRAVPFADLCRACKDRDEEDAAPTRSTPLLSP